MIYHQIKIPIELVWVANDPRDPKVIESCLEIAVICLTPKYDTQFTLDTLLAEARSVGGEDLIIEESDIRLHALEQRFLQEIPNGMFRMK